MDKLTDAVRKKIKIFWFAVMFYNIAYPALFFPKYPELKGVFRSWPANYTVAWWFLGITLGTSMFNFFALLDPQVTKDGTQQRRRIVNAVGIFGIFIIPIGGLIPLLFFTPTSVKLVDTLFRSIISYEAYRLVTEAEGFHVTAGGKTYKFDTEEQASAFKKKAGIQ